MEKQLVGKPLLCSELPIQGNRFFHLTMIKHTKNHTTTQKNLTPNGFRKPVFEVLFPRFSVKPQHFISNDIIK